MMNYDCCVCALWKENVNVRVGSFNNSLVFTTILYTSEGQNTTSKFMQELKKQIKHRQIEEIKLKDYYRYKYLKEVKFK